MTPRTLPALVLTLVLGAAGPALAQAGALKVGQPWSRATPGGAKVAAGYVTVTNTGAAPDRLTGGSFERAGRVELHTMSTEGGVMRMAPLPNGIEVRPGETVTLSPGGNHLMFLDLSAPLKQGEAVRGTLTFEKAGTVPVEFAVGAIAAKAPGEKAQGDKAGGHSGHAH
ncbi:copper chaperone PCu(A)C [uncultured Methylobacterium sp.]|jgi:copper(I)-binding protein|uniref:copper chaperone PCu(A)C n=1 Tax=uncultured Methylobacterium sp. TaxID=157278 RepID=UPI002628578A|nr:copper chaperone PCu(A)C [uncultured Methylobacterium sp.]